MLEKLMEIRDAAKSSLRELIAKVEKEGRLFNDEEKAQVEKLKAEASEAESQIDSLRELDLSEEEAAVVSSLTTVKSAGAIVRPVAAEAKRSFENIDEFLATIVNNPDDQRLEMVATQSMNQGSAGGFAIPTQFVDDIKTAENDELVVRNRAMVIPAGSPPDSEISLPALNQGGDGANSTTGGVQVNWLGEEDEKQTTSFKLRNILLKPHEIAAIVPFTDKLLRNLSAASSFGANLLRKAISEAEELAFLTGNGVAKPIGVLESSGAYVVERDTANDVKLADLKAMFVRFKGSLANALWLVDRLTFVKFLDMVGDGSGGTNVISVSRDNPINFNSQTGLLTIYGLPVKVHDYVSALGSQGDVSLCDFSKYYIKDGSGPIIETGHNTDDFKKNRTSMKVTWNVDGKAMLESPLKTKQNVEVSPFVVLGDPAA